MNERPSGQRRSLMDTQEETIAVPTPRILLGALLFAMAHLGSGTASASLGDVVDISALGEPLRVEIRAPGFEAQRLTCLRVAGGAGSAGVEVIRDGIISVSGSGANARLVVRGRVPTREPIAQLTIRDLCEARLERAYTLFLDPPRPQVITPTQSSRPPSQPVQPARARDEQTWATVRGESLDSISRALYPNDAAARKRFNEAAIKANPELFAGGASITTPLPPGGELRIPDLRRAPAARTDAPAPAKQKPKRVPEQPAPPPGASASTRPAKPSPAASAPSQPGKLVLEGEQAETPLPVPPPATRPGETFSEAELVERERMLVASIDRTIKNQLEMSERLRRLEEVQVALRAQLEVSPTPVPQRTPPAAADGNLPTRADSDEIPERSRGDEIPTRTPQRPAGAESASSFDLQGLLLAAGGAALAAAAWLALRRRREATGARVGPTTETAADVSVWPDEAPTSIGERSAIAIERATTPSGFSVDGLDSRQPQPARSPLAFHTGDDVASPEAETLPPVVLGDEAVEEHDSAVELADIMISFGRVHGAAETLADFIRSNPKQAVTPWLKLMEVYRLAGMRMEFDALARQLNKTFNVKAVTWDNFDEARQSSKSIESMPHLCETLTRTWGTRECQAFLEKLLRDNRDGLREGFPISAIDEILTLSSVLEDQLGKYKPEVL